MAHNHLYMGAKRKDTDTIVLSKNASKKYEYSCPDCEHVVVYCKGDIVVPYFRHKKKSTCTYFEKPNETQIHKNAKNLLADKLTQKHDMIFYRVCNCEHRHCEEKKIIFEIDFHENQSVIKEHRYDENVRNRADISLLHDTTLKYIFEIFHTHKTEERNRPTNIEWFDVDATQITETIINTDGKTLEFECVRPYISEKCLDNIKIDKEEEKRRAKIEEEINKKKKLEDEEYEREDNKKQIHMKQQREMEMAKMKKENEKHVKNEEYYYKELRKKLPRSCIHDEHDDFNDRLYNCNRTEKQRYESDLLN